MRWLETARSLLARVLRRWAKLVAKILGVYVRKARRGVGGGAPPRHRPGVFDRRWSRLVLNLLKLPRPRPYRTFNALQLEYHG